MTRRKQLCRAASTAVCRLGGTTTQHTATVATKSVDRRKYAICRANAAHTRSDVAERPLADWGSSGPFFRAPKRRAAEGASSTNCAILYESEAQSPPNEHCIRARSSTYCTKSMMLAIQNAMKGCCHCHDNRDCTNEHPREDPVDMICTFIVLCMYGANSSSAQKSFPYSRVVV